MVEAVPDHPAPIEISITPRRPSGGFRIKVFDDHNKIGTPGVMPDVAD